VHGSPVSLLSFQACHLTAAIFFFLLFFAYGEFPRTKDRLAPVW